MESIQGKHFSITDPESVNTVIYRINKTPKEYQAEYPKYTVERLVSSEELKGNLKKKTFFIDEPNYEEQLVFLSFGKGKVVVNTGIMEDDKIKISKRPMPVQFNTLYSEEKEGIYKEFKYTPNLQRPITIIDPETTEEVKPVLYMDESTNEVKGKCQLKPYKSYFSFEVRDKKDWLERGIFKMNQTTEDSNKRAIIVGGDIVALEDGTIKIPPEQAKDFTPIFENVEKGNVVEFSVNGDFSLKNLSTEQLKEFLEQKRKGRPYEYEKYRKVVEQIIKTRENGRAM